MAQLHVIKQGECFSSVAKKYGFLEKTLWNHPSNSELKTKRNNPNVLFPGDKINIPDPELKEHSVPTEDTHVYKVSREKIEFSLQVLKNDEPVANAEYVLTIDGNRIEARTDGDGWIHQPISQSVKSGKLVIADADLEYDLHFGYLDPVDEISGVQSRLRNLGHYFGRITGESDYLTEAALLGFQRKYQIPETGESDDATKAKLKEIHGS